ncbi:MAG: hypothetical protein LBP59_06605 [Planctomycetaceae bacterium]|nr:hypothetical protein [Planctomycetaceae bacterium]
MHKKMAIVHGDSFSKIRIVIEIQRFKSVRACRPQVRQAAVNENSIANSLK